MKTGPSHNLPARIGRYEIIRWIGQGGMADVFLGRSVGPGGIAKRVCIKRIRTETVADPRALERFSQEARTSFELQHANIVTVFDFGRDGQELFLVMEWIDGCDLATLLRALRGEGQRLSPILAAHVITAVAKALAYAHGRLDHHGRPAGLLHRDVTPSNILLSRRGEVFLTDFGIARALGREGAPAGTPAYVAPEQARGEAGDASSDLYSLGLVLAEMLVGHRLREERPTFEAAAMPVDIPDLFGVPAPIAAVARSLLSGDPAGRPGAAAEVERALLATLAEEVLRGQRPAEQSLALLVEKAAPANEPGPESAGPRTEAAVTQAAPTLAPGEADRAPRAVRAVRRWPLVAAAAGALGAALMIGKLGATRAPSSVPEPVAPLRSSPSPSPSPVSGETAPPDASAAAVSPAPRRRAAPATAQLRVTAPGSWVAIYLNGQKLGDDAGLFRIPPGKHQLRVANPPLHFERSQTITVRAGETLELEFHPGK